MRDPGFADAAGLLGLLGAAWAGSRSTRLPKLGCHANRDYVAADHEAGASAAGEKKKTRRRRQEERGAAKAAGPRRHYL